jgi:NAD(P)-dependent dehydrogenase (short-subunit alcohol dehydrogenase family)
VGKLDGKVAIITGAAGGIGEASARLFVEQGARVLLADIQDSKGIDIARELGTSADYIHTDVTQEAEVKAAIGRAQQLFGRLDCMFNNAGSLGMVGPIDGISVEAFESTVALLLRGTFLGMKHAAGLMKRQHYGSIITTASIAGFQAILADHTYGAAKAAIIQLTRSVAMELAESGVRVNCISPGHIATGIIQRAAGLSTEAYAQRLDLVNAVLAGWLPIKRAETPMDVARAALWLASDDASFVTGHNLVVDGGFSVGRTWTQFQKDNAQMAAALLG